MIKWSAIPIYAGLKNPAACKNPIWIRSAGHPNKNKKYQSISDHIIAGSVFLFWGHNPSGSDLPSGVQVSWFHCCSTLVRPIDVPAGCSCILNIINQGQWGSGRIFHDSLSANLIAGIITWLPYLDKGGRAVLSTKHGTFLPPVFSPYYYYFTRFSPFFEFYLSRFVWFRGALSFIITKNPTLVQTSSMEILISLS